MKHTHIIISPEPEYLLNIIDIIKLTFWKDIDINECNNKILISLPHYFNTVDIEKNLFGYKYNIKTFYSTENSHDFQLRRPYLF